MDMTAGGSSQVLILTESIHPSLEVSYGQLLYRCQLGNKTREDSEILNTRYLNTTKIDDEVHRQLECAKTRKNSLL